MQSDDIFPALPGLAWSLKTVPMWSTGVQTSQALREVRISYASAPVYTLKLSYEFLRAGDQRGDVLRTELDTLADFFHGRRGRAVTFLFRHWYDFQLRDEVLGTGDGVTTVFPFGRTIKGNFEPVWWVDPGSPLIVGKLMWASNPNTLMWGTPAAPQWTAAYEGPPASVVLGQLQLASAPAPGQPVLASASFFYRARFDADEQEFENFMQRLWKPNNLNLRATLGGKL